MARRTRFSQEVRERAVRMVFEHGREYGSEYLGGSLGRNLKVWGPAKLADLTAP
jgi:hypothetical protein